MTHTASQLVDTNGILSAAYEYDAFGKTIKAQGALATENKFRFSTKQWDDETGLGYWGYRYYSAELGRWLSRDPLGEVGGYNLYGFVGNNVINEFDIYGLIGGLELFEHYTREAFPSIPKYESEPYDIVIMQTRKALEDFFNGIPNSYSFGGSATWTQRLKKHPHIEDVRKFIKKRLKAYCAKIPFIKPFGNNNFNLNSFSRSLKI
ncbi:MAG: RHS repeat-associated core domain-containing protein [Desulfobacterales bacterium]|nr:RHS repeat-associated core domain-containing protein [Desulfobacterales bacterium]